MNERTRQAVLRRNRALREKKEARELEQLETEGSSQLSAKSSATSVGGMLGSLGGSALAKYIAAAALTAATGGAAGPAVLAMLKAATLASPVIGAVAGSAAGSALGGATAGDINLRNEGYSANVRAAAGDTQRALRDEIYGKSLKNAMISGATSAVTGGGSELVKGATEAGKGLKAASNYKDILAATAEKANKFDITDVVKGVNQANKKGLLSKMYDTQAVTQGAKYLHDPSKLLPAFKDFASQENAYMNWQAQMADPKATWQLKNMDFNTWVKAGGR